jgi:hypothetical protein
MMEQTGLNAALGVDDVPLKLEAVLKGYAAPAEYFDLFRNSLLVHKESHVWFRDKVVTMIDDHDQVCRQRKKERYAAGDPRYRQFVFAALALNMTTLGIPCIYYGTEQGFDGEGGDDRYLRECLFGGEFGAFRTRGVHFFDPDHPVYRQLAELLALRRRRIELRRGRQYLREISGDGVFFGVPAPLGGALRSVVAWSRIFDRVETVCAVNTDIAQPQGAWVGIDATLHRPGDALHRLYPGTAEMIAATVPVEERAGRLAVYLTLPPGSYAVYSLHPNGDDP